MQKSHIGSQRTSNRLISAINVTFSCELWSIILGNMPDSVGCSNPNECFEERWGS
jgi:hypothetical protein